MSDSTLDSAASTPSTPAPDRPCAVVSGATSGIGRAVVDQLTEHGWQVIALGRSRQRLDELAAHPQITSVALDLTADDLSTMMPERVDAVVHAAGLLPTASIEEITDAEWDEVFAVNVTAAMRLARAGLPALRRSQGTIVFLNSGAGVFDRPKNTVYGATKHALRGFANGLRADVEHDGVRVTSVYPGPTDTPMLAEPKDRSVMIQPATVARAVVGAILASDDTQLTDIHVRPRAELR